jgi:hypothetical protein
MKKILYILSLVMLIGTASYAQDGGKVRERMEEYLQKRLNLSKSEAERFSPVFLEYFNELRKTNMQYRGDKLVLQQKIVDLRLRYREQFKPIMGEKRSNDVFVYEHEFIKGVRQTIEERNQNRIQNRPGKRF